MLPRRPRPLNTDRVRQRLQDQWSFQITLPQRRAPRPSERGMPLAPGPHSESVAENARSIQSEKQPRPGPLTNGPGSPSLSNPGGPKAASYGKLDPGSTGPQGDPRSLPAGFPSLSASRVLSAECSSAQRTPAGTPGRSWRGKRAVPGGWEPAKRLMEHSWGRPARL